jgi:hypothetical protein
MEPGLLMTLLRKLLKIRMTTMGAGGVGSMDSIRTNSTTRLRLERRGERGRHRMEGILVDDETSFDMVGQQEGMQKDVICQ